jgi:hypothetical protein
VQGSGRGVAQHTLRMRLLRVSRISADLQREAAAHRSQWCPWCDAGTGGGFEERARTGVLAVVSIREVNCTGEQTISPVQGKAWAYVCRHIRASASWQVWRLRSLRVFVAPCWCLSPVAFALRTAVLALRLVARRAILEGLCREALERLECSTF